MNNSKIRILHIIDNLGIGGAQSIVKGIFEARQDKKSVFLYALRRREPQLPIDNEGSFVFRSFSRFSILPIFSLRRFILKEKISVLHCHLFRSQVFGWILKRILFQNIILIFHEHGQILRGQRWYHFALKKLSKKVNLFIAISKAVESALINSLESESFPPEKIKIIYSGINDSRFLLTFKRNLRQSLKIGPNKVVLGTVARLNPIKNHKMMIKALGITHEKYSNTYLLIVGDGPEREVLQSLAREMGLSSHIIFIGFREDVYRYLKIMDIFLLTSFSEGLSISLLEAMACGLPCIVTNIGGPQEIVKDGETGFVIPCNDEIALSEKIEILLNDVDLRKRMGQAGRKRFEENFTLQKMVLSCQTIYNEEWKKQNHYK